MIEIAIPGRRVYRLENLVLDLNGTLSLDGGIIEGVAGRLGSLSRVLNVLIITADTHGKAGEIGESLGVEIHRVEPGDEQSQKLRLVQSLGSDVTASIGNGANDVSMLEESAIGICVLGPEGTSAEAVTAGDILVPDINAALDLLLKPDRLRATLRR